MTLWSVLLVCFLVMLAGCRREQAADEDLDTAESGAEWRANEFAFAVDNLQRLEQFSGGEMRQQMIDRLNQWVQREKPPAEWKVDPLVVKLPKPLAERPELRALDEMVFSPYDGFALQEAVWLRDVSNWTRGKDADPLAQAQNMFDWVVCNVQLESGTGREADRVPQFPWETLLWGRGTATDRAWVFLLMLRQQGIDAAILSLPDAKEADGERLDPWAVGAWIDKQLYLFDPSLGLPIPGPGGAKYEDGRLVIRPATLSEVAEKPALLRALDVPEHPYPVDAKRLAGVVALVEASPSYLEARMRLVESRLVGPRQAVLTTRPSEMVERLKDASHLAGRRLWLWPYELLALRERPSEAQKKQLAWRMAPLLVHRNTPLWKGRVLHLKGKFAEQRGAMAYYQAARPSRRALATMKRIIAETTDPTEAARLRANLEAQVRGKGDATYWIGLVEVAENRPELAVEYFQPVALIKAWRQGAHYNLGRVAETLGRPREAAAIYRTAPSSPDTPGLLLRARWLEPAREEIRLPGA
ncbi:MAG TPA: hypothetical protein VJL29_04655 [Thermoguttaceae bacterium]|nr:hypothetical protein [Thermoguttaceae bacterium]